MKLNRIKIIVFVVALMTFTACKTTRTVMKTTLPDKEQKEVIHELTDSEMVQRIQNAQPAFHTANASKMSVYVDFKGRQMDVKASCKIVSDSALYLSIQPFFGVELFKLELTPTTFILVDKMNKMFYESNYSIFRNTLGITVNYNAIQSLISNRLFIPGNRVFLPDDFKWKNNLPGNTLVHQNQSIDEEVMVDTAISHIAELVIKSIDKAYTMNTEYSDFKEKDGILFPHKIFIDGNNVDSKSSFHFTIEEVQFNRPLIMEPTNLSRYTRGDINSFFRK